MKHAASAISRAVLWAVALLGWAVVLMPMWLVRRATGQDLHSASPTDRSAFVGRDSGRTPDLRARRPGSPAGASGPPNGPTRSIVAVAVVLGLIALVGVAGSARSGRVADPARGEAPGAVELTGQVAPATGVIDLRERAAAVGGPVRWAGLPVDDYAHEDEPFAQDLFRELSVATPRPDPMLGARLVDARGDHVNIVDGRRATWQPDSPGAAEVTVWYFGGSTMFGIGQRDDHTIPSVVAKLAETDGITVRSWNFGVSADVNWTETLRFAEALGSDLPRPDLVVFYDGSNDQGLGFERVDTGRTDAGTSSRLSVSDGERAPLTDGPTIEDPAQRAALAAELAAAQYGRGVRVARALAADAGVPVVHFWQPQPFAKEPGSADAELYRRLEFDPALLPAARAAYDAIRERSGVDPIDLSRTLDDVEQPVFFDGSHTNELGARIVAAAMYERLRPLMAAAR